MEEKKEIIGKKYKIIRENKHTLTIYDLENKKDINKYSGLSGEDCKIEYFCLSPDEKYLIIANNDNEDYGGAGFLIVLDIENKKEIEFPSSPIGFIQELYFSKNGKFLHVNHWCADHEVFDFKKRKLISKTGKEKK